MARRDYNDVKSIKAALYHGEHQRVVAKRYNMSQPSISAIVRGRAYPYIPWPDGSIGPLNGKPKDTNSGPTIDKIRPIPIHLLPNMGKKHSPIVPDIVTTVDDMVQELDIRKALEEVEDHVLLDSAMKLQEQDNEDVRSALMNVGESPDTPTKSTNKLTIADVAQITWAEAIKLGVDLPAIAAAEEQEELRPYICAILKSLDIDDWTTMPIMNMAITLKKELG